MALSEPKLTKETHQEDSAGEADKPEDIRHIEELQKPSSEPPSVKPSPTSSIAQSAYTKRKRRQQLEVNTEADELQDERPSKLVRQLSDPQHPGEILQAGPGAEAKPDKLEDLRDLEYPQGLPPLSEKDLSDLYEEVMNARPDNDRRTSIPSSQPLDSITAGSGITQETTKTKGSPGTNAFYRFEVLAPAEINIHADQPPKEIQDAIDAIIKPKLPDGRQEELNPIVQNFKNSCVEMCRGSASEDDFLRIFSVVLPAMGFDSLCFHTGVAWDNPLKPKAQHTRFHVDSLAATEKQGTIKTPRPDISMGLFSKTLASTLSSQGLRQREAEKFLKELQRMKEEREPEKPPEPILISSPARCATALVFPFAVAEMKAYLTGKQISEAENQAAGGGACALSMQLRLDELANRYPANPRPADNGQPPLASSISPECQLPELPPPEKDQLPKLPPPEKDQIPLFFSICTEGPIHTLWVHWTEVKDGVRQYNMMPLKCVYGTMSDELMDFFIMVDNVLRWGTGHFLKSLVVRLGRIAAGKLAAGISGTTARA